MHPRDVLAPLAHALIAVYYAIANRCSDSQTSAVWTQDHYQCAAVPLGYVAELRLVLRYKPKESELDLIQDDRSQDA